MNVTICPYNGFVQGSPTTEKQTIRLVPRVYHTDYRPSCRGSYTLNSVEWTSNFRNVINSVFPEASGTSESRGSELKYQIMFNLHFMTFFIDQQLFKIKRSTRLFYEWKTVVKSFHGKLHFLYLLNKRVRIVFPIYRDRKGSFSHNLNVIVMCLYDIIYRHT